MSRPVAAGGHEGALPPQGQKLLGHCPLKKNDDIYDFHFAVINHPCIMGLMLHIFYFVAFRYTGNAISRQSEA